MGRDDKEEDGVSQCSSVHSITKEDIIRGSFARLVVWDYASQRMEHGKGREWMVQIVVIVVVVHIWYRPG
jgi:hypothetical protein